MAYLLEKLRIAEKEHLNCNVVMVRLVIKCSYSPQS